MARSTEEQHPRDSFTHVLKKIVRRIEARNTFQFEPSDGLVPLKEKITFKIVNLWVFGPWTSPPSKNGALNLLAEISIEAGYFPSKSTMRRLLAQNIDDLQLHLGTPQKNDTGAPIVDAVFVWSENKRNWKDNIRTSLKEKISSGERGGVAFLSRNMLTYLDLWEREFQLNMKSNNVCESTSGTTNAKRKNDFIPLRPEQIRADGETLAKLIEMNTRHILKWHWTPFSILKRRKINWSEQGLSFFKKVKQRSDKKTAEAMEFVVDWFEMNDTVRTWAYAPDSRDAYWVNGNRVDIGRRPIALDRLAHHYCYSLLIVPRITRRGPNGLWRIMRGRNHEIEQTLKTVDFYCLKNDQNQLDIQEVYSNWRLISSLRLFRNQLEAEIQAGKESDFFNAQYTVAKYTGSEMLKIIACVDHVVINQESYAISKEGEHFRGEVFKRPSLDELKKLLHAKK